MVLFFLIFWLSNDKFDLGLFLLAIGLDTMGMALVLDFSFLAVQKNDWASSHSLAVIALGLL